MELTQPCFNKVLVANRGAIACRIIRTLRAMGITSVAVYAEADADSLHVRQADEAWPLEEGSAADTYLSQDKLFHILAGSGARAVHPGYGFLSENAGFARRCEAQGIAFLGPTPEQMEQFGLKHTARALAEDAGVPLLPGTGLLSDLDEALSEASRIGYPVMLKSTAGGGGIGMSRCYSDEDLAKTFESVQRLSQNNFSNGGVCSWKSSCSTPATSKCNCSGMARVRWLPWVSGTVLPSVAIRKSSRKHPPRACPMTSASACMPPPAPLASRSPTAVPVPWSSSTTRPPQSSISWK